jgi:hypothetical protein
MTTLYEVGAVQEFGRLATREGGRRARQFILDALKTCDSVQIDMTGMYVSPSFADEFFGMLAAELGLEEYAHRVHLINIPDSAHDLIAHVVYRRGTKQQSTATGLQIPLPTREAVVDLFKKATRKREKN